MKYYWIPEIALAPEMTTYRCYRKENNLLSIIILNKELLCVYIISIAGWMILLLDLQLFYPFFKYEWDGIAKK